MSSYVVNREPEKYGGQQKDYLEQVKLIVEETANKFSKVVQAGGNITELFHQTIASMSAARNSLAVKHKTKEAENFGFRRDKEPILGICGMTSLSSPYQEYNTRLLPVLQKHLSTFTRTLRQFEQRDLKITLTTCLGRKSSIEYSVLSVENMKDWAYSFSEEETKLLYSFCEIPIPETLTSEGAVKVILNKEAMQKLKDKSFETYKKLKIAQAMIEIKPRYDGLKSDWVLATVRLEVNGKMYALSQYLTWMYRDFMRDPVEKMSEKSVITVIHQDLFLIDVMLKDIANIFERIIKWNGENLRDLKQQVALFEYEFAHAMPFNRGSGAISEWLEMALYRYHGFKMSYDSKKNVNFEALTSTLEQFVKNYDSMIRLEKIEKQEGKETGQEEKN